MGAKKQKKKPDMVLTYRKDVSFGVIPCVRFSAKLGVKHGGTEYKRTFWFLNEKRREKFLTQTVPNDLKTQFEVNAKDVKFEVNYE